MSCKIFVDTNNLSPATHSITSPTATPTTTSFNCYTNSSNNKASFSNTFLNTQSKIQLSSILGRGIGFRRLRSLKFYMASALIVAILFILLRPRLTNPGEPEVDSFVDRNLERSDKLKKLNDLKQIYSNNGDDKEQRQTKQSKLLDKQVSYSTELVEPSYPNNLTRLLTAKDFNQLKNVNFMQAKIRDAMKHSWDNYRRYAWGYDMLKPRSKEPDHWFDLGLTIVDSADTLIMMGLGHDANLALDWMENELNFTTQNENSNCFELTIRVLAGILSAYHLTGRDKMKKKAIELGDVLLHCYDTESKIIPYSDIDLNSHRAHPPQWNPHSSLSEVASLQVEFRYLTQISGNPIYEQTTFQTSLHIHDLVVARGQKLMPMYINPTSGQAEDSVITLGARTDSYYEYLLKQYLQTDIKWLEEDYLDSVDEIRSKLIRHTNGAENYTYVAEMQVYKTLNNTEDVKYFNKMDHLVCFLPGTLVLGYYHFSPAAGEHRLKYNLEQAAHKLNSRYDSHLELAQELARTCFNMYSKMGTGLSAEIVSFLDVPKDADPLVQNLPELQVLTASAHNILRPEFVESLFYLYHITGLAQYRKQAAQVFESFQEYSRIPTGYTPISDVRTKPPPGANYEEMLHKHAPDRMESFWLSETLKYLFLIFCDDQHIIERLLNNYVFNTEAHPVPILTFNGSRNKAS